MAEDKKAKSDGVEVLTGGEGSLGDGQKIVLARHVYPTRLPLVPLASRPFFPKMMVPMLIDDENLKKMVSTVVQSNSKFVGLVLAREQEDEGKAATKHIGRKDIYDVGVIAEILQVGQPIPEAPMQVLLGVLDRFRIAYVATEVPHMVAEVTFIIEPEMGGNEELKAYALSIIQSIKELIKLNPLHKEELSLFMSRTKLTEPGRLADFAASMTTASGKDLQGILETVNIKDRIEKVLLLLRKETDITRLQVKISKQVEERVTKQQRDFFLHEQLKAIKKELGLAKEGRQAEYDQFEERIKKLTLPEEAGERIKEEMEKLKLIEPASPEFTVTRNYLDWLTSLPWGILTKDSFDIANAERVLNKDHYGLDDVKERILEFLSVGILKGNISGSIICFVGPPGVGKTSVGQSIAHSIGRKFYRFSLGGMRDEAEIKGHRRTYIGAMPGKFLQAIKVCKSSNPVIMLDEVDKIGASFQGDPASALLEVLDPEQNRDFLDHYLDVRFDLSNVLFICTANQLDTIPRPLLDRMEVMKLAGYITEEKLQIARKFLVPRQMKAHGLNPGSLKFTTGALREIIDSYAREPGVRGLENHIKKIMRKSARSFVKDKKRLASTVDRKDVYGLLGKRIYEDDTPFRHGSPGVVTGLAWTSLGGATLYVESNRVAGEKPVFKQTGQLGSVMIESSEIAYTYVRSLLDSDTASREFFNKGSIHLHVPAGATPKDGPSAGITMATSLYSLAVGRPVKKDLAMTGELSLTGIVMPIGGVKEKMIAAKRAGVRELIIPGGNRKDCDEIPAHIRRGLKIHFVETFKEVVDIAFPRRKRQ